MLVIPGRSGKDTCDGITRRDVLRIGGSAALGLSLADIFGLQKATANQGISGGPGFGKAKSVILLYLQGGPSHLDLWDPKDDVPDKVRSVFKAIDTKLPGVRVTELLPKFAQVLDKATLIRSMSYTPVGLFNHTAAKSVRPTGTAQSEGFPECRLQHCSLEAAASADAAVCHDAAALAGEQRRGQGRHRRVSRSGL